MPPKCTGVVNHRIHPSQTAADILEFVTKVVDDPRVKITVRNQREAHPIAPFTSSDVQYHMLAATIMQTFPDTVVVPGQKIIIIHFYTQGRETYRCVYMLFGHISVENHGAERCKYST